MTEVVEAQTAAIVDTFEKVQKVDNILRFRVRYVVGLWHTFSR